MNIALIHGFSRANSGDGLLVDLSLRALGEAGVSRSECTLVALDPDSFDDLDRVVRAPGEPSARLGRGALSGAMATVASLAGADRIGRYLASADALIAVGGGYLVADSPVRQAGVCINHLHQLRAAARHRGPTIYLPQSIGPLHGQVGSLVRGELARIDRIWVRDDLTLDEIGLPNMRRCPDLAVMELGRQLGEIRVTPCDGAPILVGRELPRNGEYTARLRALFALLPDAVWAVQADTPGPRSDRAFYRNQGYGEAQTLAQHVARPGGPVVSVRLHGAIGALLAGRAAIHLAYERKGWGAYEDLGLSEFVHDAYTFDPQLVARQVRFLAADPSYLWDRVQKASSALSRKWDELVRDLRERIVPEGQGQKERQGRQCDA